MTMRTMTSTPEEEQEMTNDKYQESELRRMTDEELTQACLSSKYLGEDAANSVIQLAEKIRTERVRAKGLAE